jgi:hypothetical protein
MHRAMVGTVRDRVPEYPDVFKGSAEIPVASTDDDPVLPRPDGGAPTPFWLQVKQAIARIETDPKSFPSDDELGRFIETNHRPTPAQPFTLTKDLTTGLQILIHARSTT